MEKFKLDILKEILSLPTYIRHEERVREYIIALAEEKGYKYHFDKKGNLYLEKGSANFFPCVVAHMDSVFNEHIPLVKSNIRKKIVESDGKLFAFHPETDIRTGLAADDLAGVFIALQMFEKFDNIKAAFFVEEEDFCKGSYNLCHDFFENIGYVLQFDAPTNNWFSEKLFNSKIYSDVFHDKIKGTLFESNITNYTDDTYTDCIAIKDLCGISCANLPTGYYLQHTSQEYVVIDDIEKSIELGEKLIKILGYQKYEYESVDLE